MLSCVVGEVLGKLWGSTEIQELLVEDRAGAIWRPLVTLRRVYRAIVPWKRFSPISGVGVVARAAWLCALHASLRHSDLPGLGPN